MPSLVIDIGNSRTKAAVFDKRDLVTLDLYDHLDEETIKGYLSRYSIQQSIISSVKEKITHLEAILEAATNYIRFSVKLTNGIENRYQSPATLGLDRLAAVIGARTLMPGANCLVIDAGTCITYDAVNTDGIYRGGAISPGLNMRLKAMHAFTGRLPEVELRISDELEGTDTTGSMLSGVLNGAAAEVEGMIAQYSAKYDGLQVFLCGGDANFFDSRLKNSIFAHISRTEPNLVLTGLNEVIHQNDKAF